LVSAKDKLTHSHRDRHTDKHTDRQTDRHMNSTCVGAQKVNMRRLLSTFHMCTSESEWLTKQKKGCGGNCRPGGK